MNKITIDPPFSYPMTQDYSKIQETLLKSQEFTELSCIFPTKNFFLNHQQIISRYISPYRTDVQSILVVHSTGTGKSGVASSLFEEFYSFYSTDFVFLFLGPNQVIVDNFKHELMKLSSVYRDISNIARKTKNIFFSKYSRADLEVLSSIMQNLKDLPIVVIVDEAHNLIDIKQTKETTDDDRLETQRYQSLVRFLSTLPRRRVIYMTATPIRHCITEVIPLMNLLLSSDEKLPMNLFQKENWKEKLINAIQGRVSFFRRNESKKIVSSSFQRSNNDELNHYNKNMIFNIFFTQMEELQSKIYLESLFNVYVKGARTRKNEITNCELISKDDMILENTDSLEKRTEKSANTSDFKYKMDDLDRTNDNRATHRRSIIAEEYDLLKNMKENEKLWSDEEKLEKIKPHSIIFFHVLKDIIKNPHKRIFVYCKYIKKSGLETLLTLLSCFNFIDGSKKNKIRGKNINRQYIYLKPYCVDSQKEDDNETIHSKTMRLVNTFNKNLNIQLIICSDKCSESLSFLDIEKLHVLSPWWNYCKIKQICGRAIRFKSHERLLQRKKIKIFSNILNENLDPREYKELRKELLPCIQNSCEEQYLHELQKEFLKSNIISKNSKLNNLKMKIMKEQEENINVNVEIFLHCSLPNMREFQNLYNNQLQKQKKEVISHLMVYQLRQYQSASHREKNIRDILYLFYQHSFDFHLNYENNKITKDDSYFPLEIYKNPKHIPLLDSEKNKSLGRHVTNYNELYSKNKLYLNRTLTKIFEENNKKALHFEEIVKYFHNTSEMIISNYLMYKLSSHDTIECNSNTYYLNYRHQYFYLTEKKEKSFLIKSKDSIHLPKYNFMNHKNRKKTYNLESIKDIFENDNIDNIVKDCKLQVKRKFSEIETESEKNSLFEEIKKYGQKNGFEYKTIQKINQLPKKKKRKIIHRKLLEELQETDSSKEYEKKKAEILEVLSTHEKYIKLDKSLKESIIAVEFQTKGIKNNNILIFTLNNKSSIYDTTNDVDFLQKKLFKHIKKRHSKVFNLILASEKITSSKLSNMNWEEKQDIIIKTIDSYTSKHEMKSISFDIFNENMMENLALLKSYIEEHLVKKESYEEIDIRRKVFDFEGNFITTEKTIHTEKDQIPLYLFSLWISIININVILKKEFSPDFLDEYSRLYKTFFIDKRLQSTGRNLSSFYLKELFFVFKKYFDKDDLKEIENDIKLYESKMKDDSSSIRIKGSMKIWRNFLIQQLKKKDLYIHIKDEE